MAWPPATHADVVTRIDGISPTGAPALGGFAMYGDGSDGDVVIANAVNVTRDMYYNNLTINSGGDLSTETRRLFVKGTLTVNTGGAVHCDGQNAINPGGQAARGSNQASVGQGGVGGAGDPGPNGAAGGGFSGSMGGAGGAGGGGATGTGGAGGVATPISATNGLTSVRFAPAAIMGAYTFQQNNSVLHQMVKPGAGGGGGGGNGTQRGGGGGSGGGVVVVAAKMIINNGRISSNGGSGGGKDPFGSTAVGGGGGGGGGVVFVITDSFTGNTPTATGGAGELGVFGGGNGVSGSPGTVVVLKGA